MEVGRVASEIKARGASRVLVQLPDGLRPYALSLVQSLEEASGAQVFLSGDSCYGSCDLAVNQAEGLGVDLLVHYGHTPILPDPGVPVLYVPVGFDADLEALLPQALDLLEGVNAVGLATTAQHLHQLEKLERAMVERGFKPRVGQGGGWVQRGQVLGCNYLTCLQVMEEVEAFLYLGGGGFHPMGIVMATGKPTVTANPYTLEASYLDQGALRALARRRFAAIHAAGGAQRFGVVASSKPGQRRLGEAQRLVRLLRDHGRESALIYLDELRAQHLANFSEFQVFVVTACPRVAVDGLPGESRPLLTVGELMVALGLRRWEELWASDYFGNREV